MNKQKESFRCLEALRETEEVTEECTAVTVCDRESDMYDFFKLANELDSSVLVRASSDRTINRKSRYAEKDVVKLWEHLSNQAQKGVCQIDIPQKSKSKHSQILFRKTNRNRDLPEKPPKIKVLVAWIAKLGGHLGRNKDGPPGTITLWRGWKRLTDLCQGAELANRMPSLMGNSKGL